jgi:hypothetical protein
MEVHLPKPNIVFIEARFSQHGIFQQKIDFEKYFLINKLLRNDLSSNFNYTRVELPFGACVRIPSECPPLLAGLDQNAQGNAGAQPNPPPNLHCGFNIPLCRIDCHTGKLL